MANKYADYDAPTHGAAELCDTYNLTSTVFNHFFPVWWSLVENIL